MDYLKYSGISAIVMRLITMFMHILIIVRVLPYQWVSGGMILEYQPAAAMAMISFCILLVSVLFYVFDLLGVGMQFMGTDFERHYASIVALFTLVADCSVCLGFKRVCAQ